MENFDPAKPYNALPLLPPQADIESRAVLKACIGARAALAELKQAGGLIPNPAILINTIPLLEARASSEIENIVTTADRLFRYAQNDAAGQAWRLRNSNVLLPASRAARGKPACRWWRATPRSCRAARAAAC
ncbi:MAG: hypothetical protein M1392_00720, partial [Gammaproteobacteria bacterium]|nr:hypothetical protein [Gammaproteobacteria bacterium]